MEYTAKIAGFVAEAAYEKIPAEALEVAKTAIIDCIGVTLAGSREKSADICGLLARGEGAKEESTVIGQGFKSSALLASLANGTASHALDYDYSFTQMGQPMAGLVAAVFSLAEALAASGREFLTAYVAGFEVTARLVGTLPELASRGGWHSPATVGSMGAAAGSARLLGLGPEGVEMALGITASMASGIVANFATMTKPLHAGLAARNGVLAAKLAKEGFTSSPAILERPKGFFHAFSRELPIHEAALDTLGKKFDLIERGIRIKPYPCGGLMHSAIDALLELRREYGIRPEAVEKIQVAVAQDAYNSIIHDRPETGLQGKFSLPYVLARALAHGRVVLDHFTDEAVKDPLVRELGSKISKEVDSTFEEGEGRRPSRVTVRTNDGRTLSRRVDFAKGSRRSPMSPEEIQEKFVECAAKTLDRKAIDQVLEHLKNLERMPDLRPLCRLLMARAQ